MLEYLIIFTSIVTCIIIFLYNRQRKTRKLLNTYRNLFHDMKHEFSTSLSVVESSYEMAFGEFAEIQLNEKDKKKLEMLNTSIIESLEILQKYSKKSEKLNKLKEL